MCFISHSGAYWIVLKDNYTLSTEVSASTAPIKYSTLNGGVWRESTRDESENGWTKFPSFYWWRFDFFFLYVYYKYYYILTMILLQFAP